MHSSANTFMVLILIFNCLQDRLNVAVKLFFTHSSCELGSLLSECWHPLLSDVRWIFLCMGSDNNGRLVMGFEQYRSVFQ